MRERIRSWAEAHPIQDSLASRQSADPDIIKKVGETNFGTLGSIKALAKSMGDLSARLGYFTASPEFQTIQPEIVTKTDLSCK